jgi:Ca2+-binding EF-hand superfamily protein
MAGVDPQLMSFFASVDTDRSGRINAFELQQVLQSSNGRKFNDQACRLMISKFQQQFVNYCNLINDVFAGLFDGGAGSIDVSGFSQLYTYVNQWLNTFRSFDRNGSGFIDSNELGQALGTMGYRFNPQFIDFLANK